MPKVLVSCFSKSGNTKRMAEAIVEGVGQAGNIDVTLKTVMDTSVQDLEGADGIVIGSPTYFGDMTAEVKELIDRSIKCFGKLNGKVGGAFTSSGGIAGGNETTIISILQALLVHGMVVQGLQRGNHYGPVSIRTPDEAALEECRRYGKQIGALVLKLS